MNLSFWLVAQAAPDRIAVVEPGGESHTFGEIHARSNQLIHGLRALGLVPGDAIAFVLPNCIEVIELFMAAHQAGWFLTPVNHHLTAPEMAWIIEDSGAKVVVCHESVAAVVAEATALPIRYVVGDGAGFLPYSALWEGQPSTVPEARAAGATMTYTSGTTGRPRGVRRATYTLPPETVSTSQAMFLGLFGILPGSEGVHLVVAPTYHTAVLNFATNHLHLGHTVVLMDKWTPEGMLQRIERYGVTSTHMVPTQFVRLLKMPAEVRERANVSSLRHMIHGAAPCPVEVKQAMLDWWGPCIYEYYAASEGGGTLATPADARKKPGSVGKPWPISAIQILDDAGNAVPTGEAGTVWIRMGEYKFAYHKDDRKTDEAWKGSFFTVGDAGYLDDDGYLFLCDRKADMIISGGVNIYPAEIEAVLLQHPLVLDAAVFGIPDSDWGEQVRAVVQPAEGAAPISESDLFAWCEGRLAKFKRPRSIHFTNALPRDPNGKLYKRKLRELYQG